LIPVEAVEMLEHAQSLPGEVLWLCRRPPAEVVGQLDEEVRGAWLETDAVVVNFDGHAQRLKLTEAPKPALALNYLARIVANCWTGVPEATPWAASLPRPRRGNQTRTTALCHP